MWKDRIAGLGFQIQLPSGRSKIVAKNCAEPEKSVFGLESPDCPQTAHFLEGTFLQALPQKLLREGGSRKPTCLRENTLLEEEALLAGEVYGANCFISSTEEGRFVPHAYTVEKMIEAWKTFVSACEIWRSIKNYDPRAQS